jgi:hypothetical protein
MPQPQPSNTRSTVAATVTPTEVEEPIFDEDDVIEDDDVPAAYCPGAKESTVKHVRFVDQRPKAANDQEVTESDVEDAQAPLQRSPDLLENDLPEVTESDVDEDPEVIPEVTESDVDEDPAEQIPEVTESDVDEDPEHIPEVTESDVDEDAEQIPEVTESDVDEDD